MATYSFPAKLWLWTNKTAPESWHFITLPQDVTDEIEDSLSGPRAGFGSVKVSVTTGNTTWKTSLFPSKEEESFVLPIKKSVREAEGLAAGRSAQFTVEPLV